LSWSYRSINHFCI